jgi:hypothetical protein
MVFFALDCARFLLHISLLTVNCQLSTIPRLPWGDAMNRRLYATFNYSPTALGRRDESASLRNF